MAARKAFLWSIVFVLIGGIISVPKSGPYDVIITEMHPCDDEGTGQVHFDGKMGYAGGGKHVYNAVLILGLPMDDNFVLKLDVQQWSSQGYRPRAIVHTAKGCKAIWPLLRPSLIRLFAAAGTNITDCPIPQGNYSIKNWEVNIDLRDSFAVLPYNKYKGVLDYYCKDVKVGCMNVLGEVVPKRKA